MPGESQGWGSLVGCRLWGLTELGREDKGEGRDRGYMVEQKESPKRERAVKPVISLPSKNGH